MQAIILCGPAGTGKTALYRDRWLETHVRLNLELMHGLEREGVHFTTCLETRQDFVVDDRNATPADRARYAVPAREAGYLVVCCLVDGASKGTRAGAQPPARIPAPPSLIAGPRFVAPTAAEGFDEIMRARPDPDGGWAIEEIAPPAVL
ncbi:MAG: hypothetical protein QOC64_3824 [Solirubrobacteraceae bacterium]|nr:hypothetical protein [Solirubrobacteraceae bacterium]